MKKRPAPKRTDSGKKRAPRPAPAPKPGSGRKSGPAGNDGYKPRSAPKAGSGRRPGPGSSDGYKPRSPRVGADEKPPRRSGPRRDDDPRRGKRTPGDHPQRGRRPIEKPGRPVLVPGGELVWGINPVSDLLAWTPKRIRTVWINPRPAGRLLELQEKLALAGVKIREAWPERLDGMTGGANHQGVAAEADAHNYAEFPGELAEPGAKTVFLLDGVTDVGNLANLMRSLLAFGVNLVVLPKDRSAGITPTIHHLSAGASLRLPVARVTNLVRAIEELKELDFTVIGTDGASDTDIRDFQMPGRVAVVLGSEGKGMRPLVAKNCDTRLQIPLPGGMESLNVSVAGAILAWEIVRGAERG